MDSSLKVRISQTVILNLSDHWTRNRIQNQTNSFRIIGALLGQTEGQTVQLFQSTELTATINNDDEFNNIDYVYMETKVNLLKQVFSDYDILGWYFTTTPLHQAITQQDTAWHKAFTKFTENPILVVIDPWKNMRETKELSLQCYEMNENNLQKISHEIEMDKAEATTVQSIRLTMQKSNRSQFAQQLYPLNHSLELLSSYLNKILKYILPHQDFLKHPELVKELKELIGKFPRRQLIENNYELIESGIEGIIVDMVTVMGACKGEIDFVGEQKGGVMMFKGDLSQIE